MSSTARTNRILLLVSENGGSTSAQQGNTRRCTDLLSAKKVAYDTVDGADAEQKEVRDRLFGISGVRGNYPQMFVMVEGLMSKIEFLGSWEKIEEMNELNDLPEEVLTKNPELVTLDMVFKECETLE
ncbi:hypothetical protein TL16_g05652 [Triparma laevis f. inornata]|uniref:Uncharacterized protein n=2 Tax=Triparma laevis TaxID=1534972 RepID=A0A9W7F7D4_9STRA|nr:hypothetical protein TL16_g05652 [Triparma laevis f. inornata]GMI06069.1 hypothetical protein TrLO_g2297 [Triparma laevis f. longispina]